MIWILIPAACAAAQQSPRPTQKEIDMAVDAGARYLLRSADVDVKSHHFQSDGLVYYALVAAGRGADSAALRFRNRMLETPLDKPFAPVYHVAIRAMALAKADPVRHQKEIARCAWWLVNAQTDNGQWDYEGPEDGAVPRSFERTTWTGPAPTSGKDRKSVSVSPLKVTRTEPQRALDPHREEINRNSSTTQYAVLGLLAARTASVAIPQETWMKLQDFLLRTQDPKEGGWDYIDPADKKNSWQPATDGSHLDQTLMMLSCLGVLRRVQDRPDPRLAKAIERALGHVLDRSDWFGRHLRELPQTDDQPRIGLIYHYYTLYSIERVGLLLGQERLAQMDWYGIGAEHLLTHQEKDGSWGLTYRDGSTDRLANTSFAILFLSRSVPSIDSREPVRPDVPTGK
jgi:hypothetical protein